MFLFFSRGVAIVGPKLKTYVATSIVFFICSILTVLKLLLFFQHKGVGSCCFWDCFCFNIHGQSFVSSTWKWSSLLLVLPISINMCIYNIYTWLFTSKYVCVNICIYVYINYTHIYIYSWRLKLPVRSSLGWPSPPGPPRQCPSRRGRPECCDGFPHLRWPPRAIPERPTSTGPPLRESNGCSNGWNGRVIFHGDLMVEQLN